MRMAEALARAKAEDRTAENPIPVQQSYGLVRVSRDGELPNPWKKDGGIRFVDGVVVPE